MIEHGPSFGFMAAEQALPRQGSTAEYGLLPSRISGIMDEDIQCLEGRG